MKNNEQKNSKFKNFLKIINPRTLLGKGIILGTILALALIIWFVTVTSISINAYINTTADKVSFSDSTGQALTGIDKAERMDHSKFTDFNVRLECQNYNQAGNTASFRVYYYKSNKNFTLTNNISTKLLLTADYVDYSSYSTTYNVTSLADTLDAARNSSTYYKTYTISKLMSFPLNAETTVWPYTFTKVSTPIAYLYLNYSFKDGTKTVNKTVILRFNYDDFNILSGGIIA